MFSSAGCILVNNNNEVLVVHQSESNNWGFPKGHRKINEPIKETAFRELKEETSIDLYHMKSKKLPTIKQSKKIYYIIRDLDITPCKIDNMEIDDYKWVAYDEFKLLKKSKHTEYILKRFSSQFYNQII